MTAILSFNFVINIDSHLFKLWLPMVMCVCKCMKGQRFRWFQFPVIVVALFWKHHFHFSKKKGVWIEDGSLVHCGVIPTSWYLCKTLYEAYSVGGDTKAHHTTDMIKSRHLMFPFLEENVCGSITKGHRRPHEAICSISFREGKIGLEMLCSPQTKRNAINTEHCIATNYCNTPPPQTYIHSSSFVWARGVQTDVLHRFKISIMLSFSSDQH